MSNILSTPTPPQHSRNLATDEQFIHAMELHFPDIDDRYIERFGDDAGLVTGMMKALGRYKPTRNSQFVHYEAPRTIQSFTTQAGVAAGAAGAAVTVTVAAAEHTGGNSRPQVGELVFFPGEIVGIITAKSTAAPTANTVTITPLRAADAIPATSAGDTLALISNAYGEGTFHPTEVLEEEPYKAEGYTQIIKRSYRATGTEITNASWINIKEGSKMAEIFGTGNRWFNRNDHVTYKNFMKDIDLAMVLGVETTNPALQSATSLFQTSTGLVPLTKQFGINPGAYTPGAMTIADWQALTQTMDQEGGAREYHIYSGTSAVNQVDNFLTDTFKNGGIVYHSFGKGGLEDAKTRAASYGFDSFHVSGYSFHKRKYGPFYHPNLLGAANYNYLGAMLGIPMDMQRDKKSGDVIPSFCCRYKSTGGSGAHPYLNDSATYNREFDYYYTGAAFPNRRFRSDTEDVARVHYAADIGLQAFGLNRYFLWKSA